MRPRTMRSNFIGALIPATIVILFCVGLLWRDPLVFWNDDYQISISPVLHDIARSWRAGEWPLLSPYSWVCGNLAGEFQYGTFSIFVNGAVVVIWSIFDKFAHQAWALSTAHLVVLTMGGYMLARQRNLSAPLATMVGLVAAMNGWIICWGASDWFGALGAFAWLPWAWWGCEKALGNDFNLALASSQCSTRVHRQDADATVWRFVWPAPFVYLLATGGFPYTILMLVLLVGWLTIKSLIQQKSLFAPAPMLLGVALGFGMASPAILALLSLIQGSAREAQSPAAHWQWIVPPTALPGLFLPNWTVKWADFSTRYRSHTGTELACGLVAPVAVLYGLICKTRQLIRRIGWELVLLVVVLIAIMLPTAGMFRWSFRWLPLLHLVLAVCAAESLRWLGDSDRAKPIHIRPGGFALIMVGAAAIAMKVLGTGGQHFMPLTVAMIVVAGIWAGGEMVLERGMRFDSWLIAAITFAAFAATYLSLPTNCGVPRYSFTESLLDPAPLDPARLYLSVYPGPEIAYRSENQPRPAGQIVRPGSTSMWGKLHFINGYSPIRPAGVATRFVAYIHGDFDPEKARSLLTTEAGPDGLLAQLGVDGITISKDVDVDPAPADEWELVTSADEGRVFHRRGPPLPHVRSVPTLPSREGKLYSIAKVSEIRESRNRIEAEIEVTDQTKPALIAFSRPYFDGYRARAESVQPIVSSERGLFPVVEFGRGSRGRLILTYEPNWLFYGSRIALVCTAIWLIGMIVAIRRQFKRSP